MVLFKPSLVLSAAYDPNKNSRGVSSAAHTLVLLLLKRLQEPYIHTSTIGKVKECLNIIATVEAGEIFTLVYMSVSPFFMEENQLRSIE